MNTKKDAANRAAAAENAEAAHIKSYKFCCGNWTTGPAGFIARIRARSAEEALDLLRRVLPDEKTVDPDGSRREDNARVEYIDAYFAADNVTLDDLYETDDVDDGEDEDEDEGEV